MLGLDTGTPVICHNIGSARYFFGFLSFLVLDVSSSV